MDEVELLNTFIKHLKDPDAPERLEAIEGLAKIFGERITTAVIEVDAFNRMNEKDGIDLSEVAVSLIEHVESVKKSGDENRYRETRMRAIETYRRIAATVAEMKKKEMPGEMLEGKIKPPKKGIYRMRRAVNG